ncbi:Inhibitor of growth protein 1 [Heterocephalus glaber]|uniref:Inhibitor of growth protein n=2 Tax=Heterocephalus glaber TaxID=10181 RepID=G5AZ43_HETGA|nr:Inhibitor of growth protein 1 [Heterocephalus glaber]
MECPYLPAALRLVAGRDKGGPCHVEDYLDSIESLPFDLQRNVSLMREIDAKYQGARARSQPPASGWAGPAESGAMHCRCRRPLRLPVSEGNLLLGPQRAVAVNSQQPAPSVVLGQLWPAASRVVLGGCCDRWLRQDAGEVRAAVYLSCSVLAPTEVLKELDEYYEKFKRETDGAQKRRLLHCIQRALIRSQELGDEKIQIVSQMVELVENRTRQVDSHMELFEAHQELGDTPGSIGKASQEKSKNETISSAEKPNNKRSRRQRNNENRENASNNHDHDDISSGTPKEKKAKTSKKKKRSKAKAEREASPADLPIDPNEPTYCLCNQVSYGEMIGCDNDECPIEWFHFSCVGLNHKPKGKWYCPKCRGENEKTMDKALEKSKKERAYNR